MKRISGFDTGKGIAVLGMLIAHTFEGGICQWDYEVEKNFLNKIPMGWILVFSPFALILLMGLFFTFISSITCTLSVLHKERNDKKEVILYIVYRVVFAVVLKWMEIVATSWWREFGIFETMRLQFPVAVIPRYSHTLDSVGVCGWFVPLVVYLIRRIRFFQIPERQVFVLTVLALMLLTFSQPIASQCMVIADFFQRMDMNGVSLIFSKIGSGPFMLAQTVPFGIIGGVIAIIITECPTCRELWQYDVVFSIATSAIAGFSLFFSHDFWNQVGQESKPPAVRLMELVVETNIIVLGIYLCEDPRRSIDRRIWLTRKGTFLRRISVVSLTAFIFEQFVCWETMKLFYLLFGLAVNTETKEYLWNIPVTLLYAVFTTSVDLGIIRLWEYGSFRFSCEYFIGIIMSILFNQEVYNRVNYKKIVYEPNEENSKMSSTSI